jgi:hypothetical protein
MRDFSDGRLSISSCCRHDMGGAGADLSTQDDSGTTFVNSHLDAANRSKEIEPLAFAAVLGNLNLFLLLWTGIGLGGFHRRLDAGDSGDRCIFLTEIRPRSRIRRENAD